MPVETNINPQSVTEEKILTDAGFYWREKDNVKVLICTPLEDAGFVNGFSTRGGGVSCFPENSLNLAGFDEDSSENIYENRRRFLDVFEGHYQMATAWQVHGVGVKTVTTDEDVANSEERFDALVSDRPNTLVGVKTADCVPILMGDPEHGSYAAVHSGWKGTSGKIVTRAVENLQSEYGSFPKDMICAIGPCASGRNYEVGQDVMDTFVAFPGYERYFVPSRPGHALLDLGLVNRDLLEGAGVNPSNIFIAPFCTIDRTDLFFSYRVERKLYGKSGRSLSVVGRRK